MAVRRSSSGVVNALIIGGVLCRRMQAYGIQNDMGQLAIALVSFKSGG